jgi:hypothetical protein
MSDMLPYLVIVLCCAQLPFGIVIGVLIERYQVSVSVKNKREGKKSAGAMKPTNELNFVDIDD